MFPITELWERLELGSVRPGEVISSPFRADAKPSLEVGGKKNIAHDFARNQTLDTIDLVCKVRQCGFQEAVRFILDGSRHLESPTSSASPTDNVPRYSKKRLSIAESYQYTDETDALLYEVVRCVPKDFRQRRLDGNGRWVWNLGDVRRVLFRLAKVVEAVKKQQTVFIAEGEKDVQSLERLGLVATCNCGGAGKWRPEYSDSLRGADVVIFPDNDDPGRRHGVKVARMLQGVARTVRVVELPGLSPKGDVSDWIEAGGTHDSLKAIAESTAAWEPGLSAPEAPSGDRISASAPKGGKEKHQSVPPLDVAHAIKAARPTLVSVQGVFWEFTGQVYEQVAPNAVDAASIRIVAEQARRAFLADVRHLLMVESDMPPKFFDQPVPQTHLVLENGALSLITWKLKPHSPEFRARNLLPVCFDQTATCPRFEQALREWLPGDVGGQELLVEWMGYCLVADVTMEKALFLVGEGGNGKGRYIRILESLLGRRNVSGVSLSALRADRTFPTAALDGKLLNVAPESELSTDLDEGWLKSLISGDTVEVERKGRDPFSMRPSARFVIQSNNPPHITDKSEGIWRRLIVVRFSRSFAEHEQDRDLDAKLEAEASGILNLALQGLANLRARGRFDMTPDMIAERDSYRRECNPLATWKDERLVAGAIDDMGRSARLSGHIAYEDYRKWCRDNGHSCYARSKFTRELQRLGVRILSFRDDFGKTQRGFEGIRLA